MKKTRKRKKLCNLTPKTKWFMLNNFVNLLAFLDANICVPTPRLQNSEKKLVYIFFREINRHFSPLLVYVCVCMSVSLCAHGIFSPTGSGGSNFGHRYMTTAEEKMKQYQEFTKKDAETAERISSQMRKIQRLQESIANWKVRPPKSRLRLQWPPCSEHSYTCSNCIFLVACLSSAPRCIMRCLMVRTFAKKNWWIHIFLNIFGWYLEPSIIF